MKSELTLCVFISNIYNLENLEETMKIVPPPKNPDILKVIDLNAKLNQSSLVKIKDFFYVQYGKEYFLNIERIYFGVETCENLIPKLPEVQRAFEFCKKHEYDFTFVTPYVGPKGMDKLRPILDYLNKQEEIEVVVNDFGVLQLINKQYTNLIPNLGRLLAKNKRDPRFSISGYDIKNDKISNIKTVEKLQLEAIQNFSMDVPVYQKLFKSKGIRRVGMDVLPQKVDFKKIKSDWGFPIDIYWPWTYITSGRNCAIAAVTQPLKKVHPTEEDCYFQCRMFEFRFSSDKQMFESLQKGNAVWMNSFSLWEDYFKQPFGRLIYQPYIPV